MAQVSVTGTPPWQPQRGTCSATPGNIRLVVLDPWARVFTVEAPVGGSDLTVQRADALADEGALDLPHSVDVIAGAGPRVFVASGGQQAAQLTKIGVASLVAGAPFTIEIETAKR